VIADAALGSGLVRVLLSVAGLVTLALAAGLLLAQRDYSGCWRTPAWST
jgi:hydrogenase-4 component F